MPNICFSHVDLGIFLFYLLFLAIFVIAYKLFKLGKIISLFIPLILASFYLFFINYYLGIYYVPIPRIPICHYIQGIIE
jgi:hypothetical protein